MGLVIFVGRTALLGGEDFSEELDFLEKAEVDLFLIIQDGLEDQTHFQEQPLSDLLRYDPEDAFAVGTMEVKFPLHNLGPEMVELVLLNFLPDFLDFFQNLFAVHFPQTRQTIFPHYNYPLPLMSTSVRLSKYLPFCDGEASAIPPHLHPLPPGARRMKMSLWEATVSRRSGGLIDLCFVQIEIKSHILYNESAF
jgi:hypothetical protein